MKRHIVLSALVGLSTLSWAHDFTATTAEGQKLYFNITDSKTSTVSVTFEGPAASRRASTCTGDLNIPSKVKYNNKVYTVTSVDSKAFSGAGSLTSVILPSGVTKIGDFAFEGCSSLDKIIFPGNEVQFGEGVFFGCTGIRSVTLGSDWTKVNLQMFRWTDKLTDLIIPAKLKQLRNLKDLKSLERVQVDPNNSSYQSNDGLLYTKDGKTLLACPRGRQGKVKVIEGTEIVYQGAFIDCPRVTSVDLPATLKMISYREFSRMKGLEKIAMRSTEPISTAVKAGQEVFLFKVSSTNVELQVPKKQAKAYKKALKSEAGEYTELTGVLGKQGNSSSLTTVPMTLHADEVLPVKAIKGVKKFED